MLSSVGGSQPDDFGPEGTIIAQNPQPNPALHIRLAVDSVPEDNETKCTVAHESAGAELDPGSRVADQTVCWLEQYAGRLCNKKTSVIWKRPDWWVVGWSVLNSMIGVSLLGLIDDLVVDRTEFVMIVAAFGAQAVLLFAAPGLPLAQPWNCVVGNLLASFTGVALRESFHSCGATNVEWLLAGFAVSLSIGLMHITSSLHPPSGAIALIAVLGNQSVQDLGFWYVVFPSTFGSVIMVLIATLINNLSSNPKRHYPSSWPSVQCPPNNKT